MDEKFKEKKLRQKLKRSKTGGMKMTQGKRNYMEKKLKEKEKLAMLDRMLAEKASAGTSKPKPLDPYTVSIAIPGSILDNAQSPELRTYLAGQIARAAVIFKIDEIVIFDESAQMTKDDCELLLTSAPTGSSYKPNCNIQMGKILQYLECPQYLRKFLFPLQKDLQYAGLLNPLDCLHHLRSDDLTIPYREAVVMNKPTKFGKGSLCHAGLSKEVEIDKNIQPNVRLTVRLDTFDFQRKRLFGTVVNPTTPRREGGYYWGYQVRIAKGLNAVFDECPYGKYDVTVGTSEKGHSIDDFEMPAFNHMLIVFGGLKGLEACVDNDGDLPEVDGIEDLFTYYLNTCPDQGSRTIRTEEAILVTLGSLRPKFDSAAKLREMMPNIKKYK